MHSLTNLRYKKTALDEVLVNQVGCYGINLGRDFILIPIKKASEGIAIIV
jgi:hypothetical protein